MLIGVTGKYGAGKDTVADYLVSKGFTHLSLSDVIREELRKSGKEVTRENLIWLGNELRKNLGNGILAEMVLRKIKDNNNFVITSIRNPGEVEILANRKDFVLVAVDAPDKLRYHRQLKRQKKGETFTSFEDFKKKEKQEQSSDSSNQQLHKVNKMAKVTINNKGTVDELYAKVDKFVEDCAKKFRPQRPTWDEYFMVVANAISKRATCDRGRSGCVMARDKQLLVSGYVGSPKGLPHCDEVGHQMKKVVHEDGSVTQHCVRTVHSEQNAICQAAKLGIPIEGATLYTRMTPCRTCAMMLINAGIKRVVCERKYHAGKESEEMFKKGGIELVYGHDELQQYTNQ